MEEQHIYFKDSRGNKIFGILHNPTGTTDRPIMILVHGHSSSNRSKSITMLSRLLHEKGISSFKIDLYGHGQSEGKFEEATVSEAVDDILQAILYLKNKGYSKIGLVGSSFGGLASIIAASKTQDLLVLALKSPVSNFADPHLWKDVSIADWKKRGYLDYQTKEGMAKLNYIFYEDAMRNDGYRVAHHITIPTLVMHGDRDTEVPVGQSIKLARLIPHATLHIIEGADHRYTNPEHLREMTQGIVDFIIRAFDT